MEEKLWLLLVLGPSAGLALSEASFLGGIRSFCMSRSLASSKEVILWFGEKPWRAPIREVLPPDKAPSGRAPVGVSPFNCNTCSDSSLEEQFGNPLLNYNASQTAAQFDKSTEYLRPFCHVLKILPDTQVLS